MKWKILNLSALVLLAVVLMAIINIKPAQILVEIVPTPTTVPTPTPDPKVPYSILLMGYAGGNHDGGRLTDSMMVVQIDPKIEQINMVSIPRDLWVAIPTGVGETKFGKINTAYLLGGEISKTIVEQVTGFKIDNIAALNFNGFVKIVDILGGIDVNVTRAFDDPMYPIEKDMIDNCGKTEEEIAAVSATMSGEKLEQQFPCRYETLHFEKGLNHMDGQTALKFARSRHSKEDGGDFNRANRQRLVILAAKEKIVNIGFLPKIVPTLKTLASNLTTDVNLERINKLIIEANEITKYKVVSVALTDQNVLKNAVSENKQYILTPRLGINNWEEVKLLIKNTAIY